MKKVAKILVGFSLALTLAACSPGTHVSLPAGSGAVDAGKISGEVYKVSAKVLEKQKDSYAAYFNKDDFKLFMEDSTGDYVGIGVMMNENRENGRVEIFSVMKDLPADRAGLKAGDQFLKLGNEDVSDWGMEILSKVIKSGKPGDIELIMFRPDVGEMKFTVKREKITASSVNYQMMPGYSDIAYIYISSFNSATDKQFEKAMDNLIKQGAKSLVLDLRDNGGGDVLTATAVADMFLEEGKVIITMEDKESRTNYTATAGSYDLPIVILQNGNTASASEMLIGALVDNNRAVSVGTLSYGKGIVQDIFGLADGSGVRITSAQYLTPRGAEVQEIGIEPNFELKLTGKGTAGDDLDLSTDNQLKKAVELLQNPTF